MINELTIQAAIKLIEDTEYLGYDIDVSDPSYDRRDDEGLLVEFWNIDTKDSIDITVDINRIGELEYGLNHERGVGVPFDSLIYAEDVHYKYILEHLKRYKPVITIKDCGSSYGMVYNKEKGYWEWPGPQCQCDKTCYWMEGGKLVYRDCAKRFDTNEEKERLK